jgi:hypothetical protein
MQILALGVVISTAVGVYAVGLQVLGLPEFTLLTDKVRSRFGRR